MTNEEKEKHTKFMFYIQNMESTTSFGHKSSNRNELFYHTSMGNNGRSNGKKAKREINCLTSIARVCLVLQ